MSCVAHRALIVAAAVGLLGGCTGTTYDSSATVAPQVAPTTSTMPHGTAADLVQRLADETVTLGPIIARRGDSDAVIGRINALWASVSAEVGRTRPELLPSFEAEVRLAQRGARLHQIGYATKAGQNMLALAAAFNAGS